MAFERAIVGVGEGRSLIIVKDWLQNIKSPKETIMLDQATLEKRLVDLEQTVADLQRKSEAKTPSNNWLQALTGSISDEAAFLEALEYGRAFRQSDKPTDEIYKQA
jgi:tetrahydromethanopterin S-methyltransferase subunit B